MPAIPTITLLVIDPSDLFRKSLRTLLSAEAPDCRIVAEAADGSRGLEAARRLKPDVILLERHLPDGNGFQLLEELGAACPSSRVLMTSFDWDPPTTRAAFDRGAAGILPKHFAADYLVEAVRRVAADGTYRPPEGDGAGPGGRS